jgi:pimeloyl-ACP methyl ester carboxylesterase
MSGRRRALGATALALALAGSVVVGTATTLAVGTPAPAPMRERATAIAKRPRLVTPMAPCSRRRAAHCGHVDVPLDPADPSAGTIAIGFELHTRSEAALPSLGTIVATEGGPGNATTSSAAGYLALFRPLLDRRDLLLVDNRGTGTSGPIKCAPLQGRRGNYVDSTGSCGRQLGSSSDLYGTAFAADDLVLVLDALGIGKIDLYGDSYGTFFSQAFAVRHPDRLRTLMLDSPYPVEGQDPWYRDENRAMVEAIRLACRRAPACASLGGDPIRRIQAVDAVLRRHPISGAAYDSDGVKLRVTVGPGDVALLVAEAAYGGPIYRELDGAIRAFLDPVTPDPAPLLRMVAENEPQGSAGPVRQYSQGLYLAAICNDYPQLWDIGAPVARRPAQYAASLARLRATDPQAFFPFTISDWTRSPWTEFRSCLEWPVPSRYVFPVPRPAHYPKVPTLVLSGDLDSLTSPAGAHIVASRFPSSTFVSVVNGTHVTAVADFGRCTSAIVVHFVATLTAGDTTCARRYNEVRFVESFPRRLADAVPAPPGKTVRSPVIDRRLATVASSTVADVLARWFGNYDRSGVGLRGGHFSYVGNAHVTFALHGLRWVDDVAVSGTLTWDRTTGWIDAAVSVLGPHSESGDLHLRWRDWDTHAVATVQGHIDGRPLDLTLPAS